MCGTAVESQIGSITAERSAEGMAEPPGYAIVSRTILVRRPCHRWRCAHLGPSSFEMECSRKLGRTHWENGGDIRKNLHGLFLAVRLCASCQKRFSSHIRCQTIDFKVVKGFRIIRCSNEVRRKMQTRVPRSQEAKQMMFSRARTLRGA